MNTLACPANITLLIHFHVCPEPPDNIGAPAIVECIKEMVADGIIVAAGNSYQTTNLGKAWVLALTQVPKPRTAYVDELGRELIDDLKMRFAHDPDLYRRMIYGSWKPESTWRKVYLWPPK